MLRPLLMFGLLLLFTACTPELDCAGADADSPECTPSDDLADAHTPGTAVWISDVHFDPFYPFKAGHADTYDDSTAVKAMLASLAEGGATPTGWKSHTEWDAIFAADDNQDGAWSVRGQDSNHKLFQEVLRRAGETVSSPDFVLVTGDFLGHDFPADYDALAPPALKTAAGYRQFVSETMAYIAATFRSAFPQAPVFATLGNNDAFCGDYAIRDDDAPTGFLSETAALFEREYLRGLSPADRDSFPATFARGGNYAVTVPGTSDHRLVVVNSIPFMASTAYPKDWAAGLPEVGGCPNEPLVDPEAALDLLEAEAEGPGAVWVAMHVPPGEACWDDGTDWQPSILSRYTSLLVPADRSAVAGAFAAHSHMASFKVVRDGGAAVSFVLQTPSISPNHGNNAAFGVLTYDPADLDIQRYQVHYLNLDEAAPTWASFPFAGVDGPVTASTLDTLYESLRTDEQAWDTFFVDYGTRADSVVNATGPVSLGALTQDTAECLLITR